MSSRFKLAPLAVAVLCISQGVSHHAFAQDEAADTEGPDTNQGRANELDEEVLVTGFRRNVLQSQDLKRNAAGIVDAIVAEDIGKSTDQNIADALSRVTGVSIQSEDGEGTRIAVRGANANQNQITLNGVELGSTDFNQGVDLSAFSSDILSKIEVFKTAQAKHDAGALGAVVALTTAKPLDVDESVRNLTVQGRYSDFSENTDYKLSGVVSQKFFDDKFGALVTVTSETNSVRRDEINHGKYEVVGVREARDLEGNIVGDFDAFASSALNYRLFQNERSRDAIDSTFQFAPSDTTEVSLFYTYAKAKTETSQDRMTVRPRIQEGRENYVEGVPHDVNVFRGRDGINADGFENIPEFSDPQADWWTIDMNSSTLVKALNRFGDGNYGRTKGGNETESHSGGVGLSQMLGDSITIDVGANFNSTELELLPNSNVNSASWALTGTTGVGRAGHPSEPDGIEPVGFDCSVGACVMVHGDSVASQLDPEDNQDNYSRTSFNPYDFAAQHVGYVSFSEQSVKDENSSFFIDVDWDIDFVGITKVEAGLKRREREKFVDDQFFTLARTQQPVVVDRFDQNGNVVGTLLDDGAALTDITLETIRTGEQFPYDNFLSSLGVPRSRVTQGWNLISSDAVFDLAFGNEDLGLQSDNTQTRSTTRTMDAAYLQANFAYFDDRLSGNVGMRYVETEVENWGYSGISFFFDGSLLQRVMDPFHYATLRDPTNPQCPYDSFGNAYPDQPNAGQAVITDVNGEIIPDSGAGDQRRWSRFSGDGWRLNDGFGPLEDGETGPVAIPAFNDGNPCYDPEVARDGTTWWWNWRHSDISTERQVPNPENPSELVDRDKRFVRTVGTHEYSNTLPSLNVAFAVTDDFIARAAWSKTISQPNFDDIKPGSRVSESVWGDPGNRTGNQINLGRADLLPQRSTNYDLSLEWYYGDGNQLSVAYFRKDQKDFLSPDNVKAYTPDLRTFEEGQALTPETLLMSEQEVLDGFANTSDPWGRGVCMPQRAITDQFNQDWFSDDGQLNKCALFNVNAQTNGAGQNIEGLEFSWTQLYDFLPGVLSGFGTKLDLTFQESETDREVSTIDGETLLPAFPSEEVPENNYNATIFWDQNGHQARLAYRYASDVLVQRQIDDGALWRDEYESLDFSATYKVNDMVFVDLNAINLTDSLNRTYWTSKQAVLNGEVFNEGSVFDGNASRDRTITEYKTGTTYRLGLRVKF